MEEIIVDSRIHHGKPVIKGTRVPIDMIIGALAGGMSYEEIAEEYGITKKQIIAAIKYASSLISGEEIHPIKLQMKA